MSTLLLMTASPHSRLAWYGLQLAQAMQQKQQPFQVFFYQDAVAVANQSIWRSEDELKLSDAWQKLEIDLPVCVSAALNRGISDEKNATRHQLNQDNLAAGFHLTGLGQLTDALIHARHVIQF